MREVTDLEAQAGFDQILEEVEKGETVRVFRDGRPIACLLPEENGPSQLLSDPVAGTPFPESTNPDSE